MHVMVRVGEDKEDEGLASLTQQLAAFSTSGAEPGGLHFMHSEGTGSSPPPPSPVNCPAELPHLSLPSLSHSASHGDMEDQPSSPSFTHQYHPPS